jgi:hypothetical protein
MTDEEFAVILTELKQLRKGIADAIGEIVHQQGEIQALRWILERKGMATADELDEASAEGARQLNHFLDQSKSADGNVPRPRLPPEHDRRKPYLCRERRAPPQR